MTTEPTPDPHLEMARHAADGDQGALEAILERLDSLETARAMDRLDSEDRARVLTTLTPESAADLMEDIPDIQAAELIATLSPEHAAAIVAEMPSDERADLITTLDEPDAEAILAEMDVAPASDVRRLASYPSDVAGGVMVTEFAAIGEDMTVEAVIRRLRSGVFADYDVQYIYIVSKAGTLVGVLRLRDLVTAAPERHAADIMIRDPKSVLDTASVSDVAAFFDHHGFLGAPVVDATGRLIGVVRRHDVEEALGDQMEDEFRKRQGIVSGEELRSMPVWRRSRRRLSWLTVNIGLNILAASVIALYQDTLSSVIALAVFLPIISDMSGCSGNQAVAVSMRELSLGLVSPKETMRVWMKEASVGVLNGLVLGLLIGLAAWAWKGNPYLGAVVGGAMALNTLLAVSIGGTVPLVLKRFGSDPALASGPILTTITDMCGFLLVLSFATAVLPRLAS